MVAWIPDWLEDTVMTLTEPMGYKLDVARSTWHQAGLADSSLQGWILSSSLPLSASWKAEADNRINWIKNNYGSRQGFHSYLLAHEGDFWNHCFPWNDPPCPTDGDTTLWSGIGYVIDKIKQVDANHKSYVVHWGSRFALFPFGITLSQFAQRFQNLGIYQVDDYVFRPWRARTYSDQQEALDTLLISYNDCMIAFKDRSTEWHAVIQTQREYINSSTNMIVRRPNIYEVRVQAYLALSRGAKGITSYIYGSSPFPPGTTTKSLLTSAQNYQANDVLVSHGLVDLSRDGYTAVTDAEGIQAFANVNSINEEIALLGSVIRKLKVYSAFPNTSIPTNSADIYSVSGDKIEIGTFKRVDQGTDSSNYVILVNRVCNTSTGAVSSPQNVSVAVNGGKYFVQDQRTKVVTVGSYDAGTNRTTFSLTLDPGEGKLFLLKKVREGTIASNQTWRDVEVIASTVTVNSGVTLTIPPNTLIKVQTLSALTINGSLSTQGTSANRITFERLGTSGDWTGIRFQAGSSGSLNFVTIRYPKKGVYIATVAPTIQNCIIENFTEQGIYVLDANPKIYTNTIDGWSGSARVGTGIYVNNSGLGSSALEITGNTVKGAIVGIDATAPVFKLEQNTLGTPGTYTTASSNAYGIVFAGTGTVTNNKTYGDNTNSWGISLAANSGTKSTTYNLLDHHNIGLVDNGFQNGSITRNTFSNNGTGFNNSDGWMTANENNFLDSPATAYNIMNVSTSCPDHTNNYLESWSSSSDPKYFNPYCGNDPWYPPAGSPFTAGPTWKAAQDEEKQKLPAIALSGATPTTFSLSSYPNPFNPSTTLSYELPADAIVSLVLYDMLGRQVRTFEDGYRTAGTYSTVWDGTNGSGSPVSTGLYLLRLQAGMTMLTHKLLLTK